MWSDAYIISQMKREGRSMIGIKAKRAG